MLLQIGTQNIVTRYVQAVGLSFKGVEVIKCGTKKFRREIGDKCDY